jgi:mannitol-1-/sugar-/sorbitol-6-phosphatase
MKVYTVKGILFDMDGVLIDSNTEIENFWKDWAQKEELFLQEEDIIRYIHGRTTHDTINELFQDSGEDTKKQILEAAIDFDLNMRPDLIKGVGYFLKELVISFHNIALVTSAPIRRAKKMLELHDVYNCFACTITGDEVVQGKPDPEPYLCGADKLGVFPGECLAFEDSNSGIISALTAGMYVIAVNNDKYQHDKIITHINSYEELAMYKNSIYINNKQIQIQFAISGSYI